MPREAEDAAPMTMRILHLGLGQFHRAHQAVYLQRLHDLGQRGWTLAAGNLRDDGSDTIAALQRQGGTYTLETARPDGRRDYQRITALGHVVPFAPDIPEMVRLAADSATRIISFTVTEAGYAVSADSTLYGSLALMLRQRRLAGAGPVTLLCCDNLRRNGRRFRSGFEQYLTQLRDWETLEWMLRNTTCPDTMVDRITPRPPADLAARVFAATGKRDDAPVMSEQFLQWVIEDRFAAGRPAWEAAGADLVADVGPYEEAKIRLLNAAHSGFAWAGVLAGTRYIHESARDPRIRGWLHDYATHDAIPCLPPSQLDLAAYRDTVFDRFTNAAIVDTHERVVTDSCAKLPGFIVPTVRDRLRAGASIDGVAMLPALCLAFLQRWDRGTLPFAYVDQALDATLVRGICRAADPVAAFCAATPLWGDLANHPVLRVAVNAAARRVNAAF